MSDARQSLLPALEQDARAEQIRDRGADVCMAVFRLVKNAMVHSMRNDAAIEAVARANETLGGFMKQLGTPVTITFADTAVFVCGQLLRASRGIYESAIELGRIVGRAGASELRFEPGLSAQELERFGTVLSVALRDPGQSGSFLAAEIPHVVVRKSTALLERRRREEQAPPHERVVRFYATALVVTRAFYEDVAAGKRLIPHRLKRLAQRMVVLAEDKNPALLGVTAMAAAHRDDAARAVQAAILAVLLGRQLTEERQALAQLAMAALLADAGRVKLAAIAGGSFANLSDRDEASAPAVTAMVGFTIGGINSQGAERAIAGFEASWLERSALLGRLPYAGAPLPQSEVLSFVRQLVSHLAPRDTRPALSPAEALDEMSRSPETSRFLLRLALRTLGLIPVGSVVELESGEWAVVAGPSAEPRAPHLPLLRVVTDERGQPLDPPRTIDLGLPRAGGPAARVARVLRAGEARFNLAHALLS